MKRLAMLLFGWTAISLGLNEWQFRQARRLTKRENEKAAQSRRSGSSDKWTLQQDRMTVTPNVAQFHPPLRPSEILRRRRGQRTGTGLPPSTNGMSSE